MRTVTRREQARRDRWLLLAVVLISVAGMKVPKDGHPLVLGAVGVTAIVVVFALLKRGLAPARLVPIQLIEHDVIGALIYDRGVEGWVFDLPLDVGAVRCCIGGQDEPDPRAIEQAVAVARAPRLLGEQVRNLLAKEALAQPRWSDEIQQLRPEMLDLDRIGGMLSFAGPHDDLRSWRCNFYKGVLSCLGFDS